MALSDLWKLTDDKLKADFERVGYEADKDRASLLKTIEMAKSKFMATEPQRGRKGFSIANNVVAFPSPKLPGGRTLKLNGRDTLFIPAERFVEFLDGLRASVEAGELDRDFERADAGQDATADVATPKVRKPRSDAGAGWSPERRAKYEATMAARKGAK